MQCRDALEIIRCWDSPETVFYIDPPYVPETRRTKRMYAHEPDIEHHRQLVELLLQLRGYALLSGYAHAVYRPLEEAGWVRLDYQTAAQVAVRVRGTSLAGAGGAREAVSRTESLWLSPRVVERLMRKRGNQAMPSLFTDTSRSVCHCTGDCGGG